MSPELSLHELVSLPVSALLEAERCYIVGGDGTGGGGDGVEWVDGVAGAWCVRMSRLAGGRVT